MTTPRVEEKLSEEEIKFMLSPKQHAHNSIGSALRELLALRDERAKLIDLCAKALAAWEGTGPGIPLDDLRVALAKGEGGEGG